MLKYIYSVKQIWVTTGTNVLNIIPLAQKTAEIFNKICENMQHLRLKQFNLVIILCNLLDNSYH